MKDKTIYFENTPVSHIFYQNQLISQIYVTSYNNSKGTLVYDNLILCEKKENKYIPIDKITIASGETKRIYFLFNSCIGDKIECNFYIPTKAIDIIKNKGINIENKEDKYFWIQIKEGISKQSFSIYFKILLNDKYTIRRKLTIEVGG